MRINEAGQDDPLAGVDHLTIGINQRFDLATPSDGFNFVAAHQHRAVFDNRELAQISARASAFRARKRYDL